MNERLNITQPEYPIGLLRFIGEAAMSLLQRIDESMDVWGDSDD